MVSDRTDGPPPPLPAWEYGAAGLLLALFVALGAYHIHHGAFAGQDFSFHVGCTTRLLGRPGEWFAQDFTNRPLIYWIALDGEALVGSGRMFAFAAGVFVLLNAAGLALLYDCARRCLTSPGLRLALLAFVAFLPVTLATSVVFAADAMAQPPFALLCWSLVRWQEAPAPRAALGYAALAGAALVIGIFAKFSFLWLPLAVLVLAVSLAWWRRVPSRHLAGLLALGVAGPLLAGIWLHLRAERELAARPPWHRFDPGGTDHLSWRSLLGPRAADVHIFTAPTYWENEPTPEGRKWSLLQPNVYSYPALLHLAIFSDVLDLGRGGVRYGLAHRPARPQAFARWSVRTGLAFSMAAVGATLILGFRLLRAVFRRAGAPPTALVVWLGLALAWYGPIALALPFTLHAYEWGYWLPRLVLPALWGFSLGLFALADEVLGPRRRGIAVLAAVTLAQAALHVGSVWY